ncbi:GDSL-like Lipase/Acylhydrolase family [Acididesulfobacillus acetoxydans]|uniref:GDSL-like Lipase/Acylhydrolase family n=2 Tax=Acididesulfobacillus acetoxydans TaxID=1561005 RepID=A0A8S0X5M3_9FIRM|nr:GDSL-like Lipase/Acylhydrolase family [Acididesulfobacillus acetoxydans]CEJ09200.1 Lipolytic protein G-D-S-L [Acididesulfobacillus acetoxydans]
MTPLYLALGDSLTAGYGVGPKRAFATVYYKMLCSHNPALSYANLGTNGLTTAGLVTMLSDRAIQSQVSRSTLITLTIGSNDLLTEAQSANQSAQNSPLLPLGRNLERLGYSLRRLNGLAAIKIASLYNPLPGGPYAPWSGLAEEVLLGANRILAAWCTQYHAVLVPVDRAFRGQEQLLLGPDHFHPNVLGHRVMADLFAHTNL